MTNLSTNLHMTMKVYVLIHALLRIYHQAGSSSVDYCNLPCLIDNKTVEHIMCTLNNDCSVGSECKVKTKFDYTQELKDFTLDMHNTFRNKAALGEAFGQHRGNLPTAADMLEMVWDEELAYFAQCYANKCILQYDKCRQSSAGENIGQLIFIRVSVNPKTEEEIITEMLEYVFHSSKAMPLEDIQKYKDNKYTKQFAQLVWARTNRVGCGITRLLEDLYAFFMVCNYGPVGNIEGKNVYNVGLTCSRCPDERRCVKRFPGLCAATEDERRISKAKSNILTALDQMMINDNENAAESNEVHTIRSGTSIESIFQNGGQMSIAEETTPTISTGMAVIISEMSTIDALYEHVKTKQHSQEPEGFSTPQKGDMVLFERLVDKAALETTTKVSIDNVEIPMRKCMVKRRHNWPNLGDLDSGCETEKTPLCFIGVYIVLSKIG